MSATDWPTQDVDLETFQSLDAPTRSLILRMLDDPTDSDHQALTDHPNSKMLATWLLQLPPYQSAYDEEED
ncbi:hypothetical protein QSJ19_01465 [Gordonia sp. ABSL11-1]|uniref:hypothetical protein n=1 Tax=Gordonia sp. ABSL11-1 TaxID=3053924 RepID=UPI0025744CEA|nr:hypothetical protein [Gordonia sp. ABSL11-1]MDL9944271.1 hypothetical protein [Gordonia sp. ABSL11-1]